MIANNYNMNTVAPTEMKLLATSMLHDGVTMPIVTIYDKDQDVYVIVDGFHRTATIKNNPDVNALTAGMVPIVTINKTMVDRIASTIRHNRARGKHSTEGMGDAVFRMLDEGSTDEQILQELGMEVEELLKLKHITGFSKLFEDATYKKAWITDKQVKIKREYDKNAKEGK